jgi:hypothetical protein
MVRSLASWLWLLDFRDRGAAVDASDDTSGELAAALGCHFRRVDVVRGDQAQLDELQKSNERQGWVPTSIQVGSVATAPFAPDTFDCVVLYDAIVRRTQGVENMLDEVSRWRAMMRRDGWLVVAAATPHMLGRRKSGHSGIARRSLTRILNRAGYREVRCLWIEYSLERPLFLIPDSRATIASYESHDAMRGSGTRPRRVAAKSGMSSLLYPGYVLFARA